MNIKTQIEQGRLYQKAGRFDEAETIYRSVLQHDRKQPEALFLYGTLACARARPDIAVSLILEAISLQPNQANYHYNLGFSYREMGELELAYPQFQRAVYLAPDDINKQVTLVGVLDHMHQYKPAIRLLDKMVAHWPDKAIVYHYYGLTLMNSGRLDEAMQMFRKAITLGDDAARSTQMIASLKKFSYSDDPDLKAIESALNNDRLDDAPRIGLCFALAKAYDDFGDTTHSFEYLARGNSIKRQGYQYNVEDDRTMFERIKTVFNKDLFERHKGAGATNNTPIFVLGMPRSGTSLVEQILSSHSDVIGAGELNDLKQVSLTTHAALTHTNYPEGVAALTDADFVSMGEAYIKRLRQHSSTANHIIDKKPHNFMAIGLIALILPNARIIHCRRDPMDTCFSNLKQNYFGIMTHKYANDMQEMGEYYRLYADLMSHWHTILPGRVLDISYEALIEDQEAETRNMIEHLNLPWDEHCLSFHDNKRAVHTASVTQVRQPIYRHAVKAWQRYETQLAPLVAALGDKTG